MSGQDPQQVAGPTPVPLRCPRCGSYVAPEQDWCLECGAPARTRLAPTPNWRAPIALVAVVVLLAGVALAFAFSSLTSSDGNVSAATTAPAQPNETQTQNSVPVAPPTDAGSTAAPGDTASSAAPAG
ncbi:MAG TPA: hypothetical protein VFG42_12920 [Baekduia sp.]|uniref:hypothetical protein n=1 Tax=Baekduia sp. TaxID=2600305 RepID=UPI002D7777C3|nr:hypothetical protein [Baekduia sp.]HET6507685.1 hypothetical protein [Baekduia sp.]